jgi:hypothetical protein
MEREDRGGAVLKARRVLGGVGGVNSGHQLPQSGGTWGGGNIVVVGFVSYKYVLGMVAGNLRIEGETEVKQF